MLGIAGSFAMQTCVRKNKGKEEIMTQSTVELASLAAKLSPSERLQLVETILATLDKPDPEMAAAWANEAEDRLAAYKRGEILAVSEAEVFGDLDDRQ
jgi:putative addiction module component (TIGR02574 family)